MRRVPTEGTDPTERTIPLILIGLGIILTLLQALALPGEAGVMARCGRSRFF